MGIGRREFLALFGGVLGKLALAASPAAVRREDLYINRKLGVAFTCPPGWDFIRLEAMGELKKGQLLAVDDPEQNNAILASLDLPFVALSPKQDETKCIQVYLADPPSDSDVVSDLIRESFGWPAVRSSESKFSKPMRIIRRDWQASRGLLKSLRVSPLPSELKISGCDAAEYTATYEFNHRKLVAPRTVHVRTVAVEHHTRFYLMRLIKDPRSTFDFSSFLSGIYLV